MNSIYKSIVFTITSVLILFIISPIINAQYTQYTVCTYASPNNIGGGFYLNGQFYGDGQVAPIQTGIPYSITPYYPSGYSFGYWSSARGVYVADPYSQSTTVTFDASGWDGTCVGNLGINYQQATTTYYTTTYTTTYYTTSYPTTYYTTTYYTTTYPTTYYTTSYYTTTIPYRPQYYVCTYASPNNIGGGFYLNGQFYSDGQKAPIQPGLVYSITPYYPSGYSFGYWSTARGVYVSNPYTPSTTATFDISGWDGTCVGNLGINYQQATTTYYTTTYTTTYYTTSYPTTYYTTTYYTTTYPTTSYTTTTYTTTPTTYYTTSYTTSIYPTTTTYSTVSTSTIPSIGGNGPGAPTTGGLFGPTLPNVVRSPNGQCFKIKNFSNYNTETVILHGLSFTASMVSLSRNSAVIDVNDVTKTLYPNQQVNVSQSKGNNFYIELTNISFVPLDYSASFVLCTAPIVSVNFLPNSTIVIATTSNKNDTIELLNNNTVLAVGKGEAKYDYSKLSPGSYAFSGVDLSGNSTSKSVVFTRPMLTSTVSFTQTCKNYTYNGKSCTTTAKILSDGNQLSGSLYLNNRLVGTTYSTINDTESKPGKYNYTFVTTGNSNYSSGVTSYSYTIRSGGAFSVLTPKVLIPTAFVIFVGIAVAVAYSTHTRIGERSDEQEDWDSPYQNDPASGSSTGEQASTEAQPTGEQPSSEAPQ